MKHIILIIALGVFSTSSYSESLADKLKKQVDKITAPKIDQSPEQTKPKVEANQPTSTQNKIPNINFLYNDEWGWSSIADCAQDEGGMRTWFSKRSNNGEYGQENINGVKKDRGSDIYLSLPISNAAIEEINGKQILVLNQKVVIMKTIDNRDPIFLAQQKNVRSYFEFSPGYFIQRVKQEVDGVVTMDNGKILKDLGNWGLNNNEKFYNCKHEKISELVQEYKKDKDIAEAKKKADQDAYARSTEGLSETLQGKYQNYMLLQDCNEVRKDYVKKYIDPSVFERLKKSLKQYETELLKADKKLNTKKIWEDAANLYGQAWGKVMKMHKTNPENYDKDTYGLCSLAASALENLNPSDQKPKKDF
jgi:hypothetical protein